MAIRWNSQLKAELRATVKSFNAKIRRLQNKGVTAALLPDKISSKEIQRGITSRRDLEGRLAQLREFTSAGVVERSEGGVMGTNQLFLYRVGEANKAVQELRKEYERVKSLETRYPMMKSEYEANLEAKMEYLSRDLRKLDIKQVNIFNKNILTYEHKAIRDENFYNNFTKMIFFNAYQAGVNPSLLSKISQDITLFTPAELLEIYNTEPSLRAMRDMYLQGKSGGLEKSKKDVEDEMQGAHERLQEIAKKKGRL